MLNFTKTCLLFWGLISFSFADLFCLSEVIFASSNEIQSRIGSLEIDLMAMRARRGVIRNQFRMNFDQFRELMLRPESEISAEELQGLRDLIPIFENPSNGLSRYASRLYRKVNAIEYFLEHRLDGIIFSGPATRDMKSLHSRILNRLDEVFDGIIADPYSGGVKADIPNRFRFVHMVVQNTHYRIAYSINGNETVTIDMVGSRQGFYPRFRRRMNLGGH